jgi:uncharacterized protein (TIGR00251 family)
MTELDVVVSPGASRTAIAGVDTWRNRLQVKVRAPPEGGRANAELEEFLGCALGARAQVTRGHTTRMKTVAVAAPYDLVIARLEALL